jgi:predicted GIY-YIG superfamily endonuclease
LDWGDLPTWCPIVIPVETGISAGMTKRPAVYIIASKRNGTLYVGVTSDLQKWAWEHKQDLGSIFGLERFVTSDRLEKIKDWIPAFARMTEDAINVAPRRTEVKQKINSGSPVQFTI